MTEACYKSYHNTATHIGGERFSIRSNGEVTAGNPAYYILRPEVVESYFYLWRLTKDTKYRDWAWEAAQVSIQFIRAYEKNETFRRSRTIVKQNMDMLACTMLMIVEAT